MSDDQHTLFMQQFARTQHRVYGYIVTLLTNRDDADDAFQETCVVLWKKWAEWQPDTNFLAWSCAVALNVVRNQRRSKRRVGDSITLGDELLEEIAAVRLESETLLEVRGRALSGCLEKLSAPQKELIESSYLGGEPMGSIASRLKITPDTLYVRLYRIRKSLLDCIDRTLSLEGSA